MINKFGGWVVSGFEAVTPDIQGIYGDAKNETLSDWNTKQKALVATSGAASMAIPGVHLAGMAADIAFLMNRMAVASYGIGAIHYQKHGIGNELSEDDFSNILAIWAGEEEHLLEGVSSKVTGKAGLKYAAKAAAKKAGIKIGNKLSSKMATKLAAKFGGKLGGKMLSGFVPFIGPAVSGTINYFFIDGVTDAAEKYYGKMVDLHGAA